MTVDSQLVSFQVVGGIEVEEGEAEEEEEEEVAVIIHYRDLMMMMTWSWRKAGEGHLKDSTFLSL